MTTRTLHADGFQERSPRLSAAAAWSILAAIAAGLLAVVVADPPKSDLAGSVVTLGVIGIWRWSWALLHAVRGALYRYVDFPRLRRAAAGAPKPTHLYVLVTSYRMPAELNAAVYRRLLEEIRDFGVGATIVACITDPADAVTIEGAFARVGGLPEGTSLVFSPQRGRGKRDAMARALAFFTETRPGPGAFAVLMDGDSVLGRGVLERTCSILASAGDLGAVTTENIPWVKGSVPVREWYRLRMAQRHGQMCSMSLSRKLLVLTGRFSVFRTEIAVDPEFILALESDTLRHWRLGDIRMVTGDDKSTWYVTLKRGWNTLYVPDAVIHPVEELPAGNFLAASTALMVRWYGNMIRNTGRAIALGPRRVGLFPWLCLVDQRISMWTTLIGPTSVACLALTRDGSVVAAYLLWVLASRSIACLAIFGVAGRGHPLFPLILYYSQVVGALVKIYMSFNPDRQRWTRQSAAGGAAIDANALVSGFLHGLFTLLFVAVVALVVLV